ncbi:hypothetical protein A4V01_03575 [Erysipelotrichaceae bacterium I46]|nr:hypothetical protein A4V01_03575 [Erysipelotrichaceae bacterium I46]ASU19487.1 hypothetical protein ADH65_13750 [[Clostridium] innocuum]
MMLISIGAIFVGIIKENALKKQLACVIKQYYSAIIHFESDSHVMKKGHNSALFSCIMLRLHDTMTSVNKGCQSPWDDHITPDIFIIPQNHENTYVQFTVMIR